MGILGRLGNVVKSYLNDDGDASDTIFRKSGSRGNQWERYETARDSDLNAAFAELEDFLSGGKNASGANPAGEPPPQTQRHIPEELRADFAELGISPLCSPEECKSAYKKLLKIHHPDRHAGNSEAMRKATEKTARVNAAYRRIEQWHKEGA
ncbi:MAG: J domain-containing protein [Treponema sp.]|nr:J domain-containing protein [Treponema sp.]